MSDEELVWRKYKKRRFNMTIQEIIRIVKAVSSKAQSLDKRIRDWNLICGLFSESQNSDEGLAYAYAVKAREICLLSMRVCFVWGLAGLKGDIKRFNRLGNRLFGLHEREICLSHLCRQAINKSVILRDAMGQQIPLDKEQLPSDRMNPCFSEHFTILKSDSMIGKEGK